MDLEWGTLSRFLPSSGSARYDMLGHLLATGASEPDRAIDLRRELESMPLPEVIDTLKELLREQIADILRIAPDKLDETRPLLEVGMDSLMGVELMTTLEANLGVTVPVMTLSEGPSIAVLAERVSRILRPPGNADDPAESPLAAQSIHLAAQHALAVTAREAADLVAELGRSDRPS
jgi:acyl carrier protein